MSNNQADMLDLFYHVQCRPQATVDWQSKVHEGGFNLKAAWAITQVGPLPPPRGGFESRRTTAIA